MLIPMINMPYYEHHEKREKKATDDINILSNFAGNIPLDNNIAECDLRMTKVKPMSLT
jgi:hypothetical protein